jgi:hypothetical protein
MADQQQPPQPKPPVDVRIVSVKIPAGELLELVARVWLYSSIFGGIVGGAIFIIAKMMR